MVAWTLKRTYFKCVSNQSEKNPKGIFERKSETFTFSDLNKVKEILEDIYYAHIDEDLYQTYYAHIDEDLYQARKEEYIAEIGVWDGIAPFSMETPVKTYDGVHSDCSVVVTRS